MTGRFITFEGGEGAGKTTLMEGLAHRLTQEKGRSVLKTREPGGTELGEEIRHLLLKKRSLMSPYAELCLFLASRSEHIREVIQPALAKGQIILCDRFNDSTIAYQGNARGLSMEKVAHFCSFISEHLTPHLTLYLDIDPEQGLQRAHKVREQDRIEAEGLAFHKKIREGYLAIAKKEPNRFHLLDASQPPAQLLEAAMRLVLRYV
ncbi:MAG: dTMP kinase [Chlamydiia bacterium]|nr:dTMP kinase [Chlamydiia bacterium]